MLSRLSRLTTRGTRGPGTIRRNAGVCRHKGFTLLELMIVVAIIIIVTASAVISIGQNGRNSLRASALEVQGLVDRARQTALAQRSPTCIVVVPAEGTFSFYAAPVQSTTDPTQVSGPIVQKVILRGGVGFPVQRGITVVGEPLSAYFNKAITTATPQVPYAKTNDYIYNTTRNIRIWFDGFGRPDVDVLPIDSFGTWPTAPRSFGWVMLTVGAGSLAVQVVVYANSGTSELRWVGK